jgi:glycosyltransferase involved in cell wall biosynthesis
MKICLISIEFTPFFGGGIGTYSELLARGLVEKGHTVHVITAAWPNYETQLGADILKTGDIPGLIIHRLPAYEKDYQLPSDPEDYIAKKLWIAQCWGGMPYWGDLVNQKLTALQVEINFDMIEFAESFADGHIYLRKRHLGLSTHNTPVTITLHGPLHEVMESNRIPMRSGWAQRRIAAENRAILSADCICSPSAILAKMVEKRLDLLNQGKHVSVIPNPLVAPVNIGDRQKTVLSKVGNKRYILFVGRMEYRKGPTYFIEAMKKVLPKYPDVMAVLVGKDQAYSYDSGKTMKDHLRSVIPRKMNNRVRFIDNMPREDVLKLYSEAVACVFPAPWDNYPYTCSEAMATNGFVIANKNSGMAEMVEHEKSGLVVDINIPEQLEIAIERALTDDELQGIVRNNARKRILSLCNPSSVIDIKLASYKETINRCKSEQLQVEHARSTKAEKVHILVLSDNEDIPIVARTVKSIEGAAELSNFKVTVTIGSSSNDKLATSFGVNVRYIKHQKNDMGLCYLSWLNGCIDRNFDYVMTLHAGDVLDPCLMKNYQTVFQSRSKVGWLGSWATSLHNPNMGYAHNDPFLPYELLHFTPAPFTMLRCNILAKLIKHNPVNLSWDKQLQQIISIQNAGYECSVIPKALGQYVDHPERVSLQKMPYYDRETLIKDIFLQNSNNLTDNFYHLWDHMFFYQVQSENRNKEFINPGIKQATKLLMKAVFHKMDKKFHRYIQYRHLKSLAKKFASKARVI